MHENMIWTEASKPACPARTQACKVFTHVVKKEVGVAQAQDGSLPACTRCQQRGVCRGAPPRVGGRPCPGEERVEDEECLVQVPNQHQLAAASSPSVGVLAGSGSSSSGGGGCANRRTAAAMLRCAAWGLPRQAAIAKPLLLVSLHGFWVGRRGRSLDGSRGES